MVLFNMWGESFIFLSVYALIILVPCGLITIIGKKMINELGRYPSRSPSIHMSIFMKLVVIEIMTFACLLGFFKIFSK